MKLIKFNKQFILGITLVSAMGGLLFGYEGKSLEELEKQLSK
jgi:hypothetical protein